jgi:VWFA-related protein
MRSLLGPAKDVAQAFFGTANPEDEFQLLTVSSQPSALTGFTTDVASLERGIDSTQSGGMTALVDTIFLGLHGMREARRSRRALLILSDGMDNYSRHTQSELMRVALEADTQIYTVVLDNPAASETRSIPLRPSMIRKPIDQGRDREGPDLLKKLSEKTGGLHFRVNNGAQAREAVIKAGQAIRKEYVIGYNPPESESLGKWHRVLVKANVPNVNVAARNGYYSH